MRLFFELAWRAFQRQMAYRSAAFAGLMTNFFFSLLRVAVMVALYQGRTEVAGVDLRQATTYTGLVQAVIGFLSIFGWYDLMNNVYSGAIAADLLKPMSLYKFWLAQDAGRAIAQLLLRGIPLMAAYALFVGVIVPTNAIQWLAFMVSLVMAWLVSFSFRFLLNLTSFWSPNSLGISRFGYMLVWFLSGFMFPLRFFPGWFVTFCQLTPFPSMVNTVNEAFLGMVDGPALLKSLAVQGLWLGMLILLGQWVLQKGIRRLVVLGG